MRGKKARTRSRARPFTGESYKGGYYTRGNEAVGSNEIPMNFKYRTRPSATGIDFSIGSYNPRALGGVQFLDPDGVHRTPEIGEVSLTPALSSARRPVN